MVNDLCQMFVYFYAARTQYMGTSEWLRANVEWTGETSKQIRQKYSFGFSNIKNRFVLFANYFLTTVVCLETIGQSGSGYLNLAHVNLKKNDNFHKNDLLTPSINLIISADHLLIIIGNGLEPIL